MKSKKDVEQFLRESIRKKVSPERLAAEERVYKILGIIPPEFDYENGLVALYTEQIGGYYDPEADYYAMADWMPSFVQMPVAVHELTHALQDQHYDLGEFIDEKKYSSDTLLAHSALVEGDATAVMLDFSSPGNPLAKQESVSAYMAQSILGSLLSPSLQKAPPALQSMLIFPYMSGLNFVHYFLRQGGYPRVDQIFRKPPSTTKEILHPELYPLPAESLVMDVRDLRRQEAKPDYLETIGEFPIATLLSPWIGPSAGSSAAKGWKADKLALYRSPSELLRWVTVWESEGDAKEFSDTLRSSIQKRTGGSFTGTELTSEHFGKMTILHDGTTVELRSEQH